MVVLKMPSSLLAWGDSPVSSCRPCSLAKGPGASAGAFPMVLSLSGGGGGGGSKGSSSGCQGSCGTPTGTPWVIAAPGFAQRLAEGRRAAGLGGDRVHRDAGGDELRVQVFILQRKRC
jgi:hypothetical protein